MPLWLDGMDADGDALWARIKVPPNDRSIDRMAIWKGRRGGSFEGEAGKDGREAEAIQGRGDANKEIFCFSDANLGEARRCPGPGKGREP